MLYYYPTILPPKINKSKLQNLKYTNFTSYTQTILYSDEGIFQIKSGKLYTVHFNDSSSSHKVVINNDEYISDTSDIILSPCQKLPFDFIKKKYDVTSYEKGSIKMIVQEYKNELKHLYFEIKNNNIYGIHDDIKELIKCAKS